MKDFEGFPHDWSVAIAAPIPKLSRKHETTGLLVDAATFSFSQESVAPCDEVTEAGYRTTNERQAARGLGMSKEIPSGDVYFNGEIVGNLHDE